MIGDSTTYQLMQRQYERLIAQHRTDLPHALPAPVTPSTEHGHAAGRAFRRSDGRGE